MKCLGVSRMEDNSQAVLISFDRSLTDDELRTLHYQMQDFLQQRQSPIAPHCKTCQCARIDAPMAVGHDGAPRKRSWHHDG